MHFPSKIFVYKQTWGEKKGERGNNHSTHYNYTHYIVIFLYYTHTNSNIVGVDMPFIGLNHINTS